MVDRERCASVAGSNVLLTNESESNAGKGEFIAVGKGTGRCRNGSRAKRFYFRALAGCNIVSGENSGNN